MTNPREFLSRGAMAAGAVAFPGPAAAQYATDGSTGSAAITKPASGKSPPEIGERRPHRKQHRHLRLRAGG